MGIKTPGCGIEVCSRETPGPTPRRSVPHTLVTSLGTAVALQLLALSAVSAHADPDGHEPDHR
jgi:hypothetical protein